MSLILISPFVFESQHRSICHLNKKGVLHSIIFPEFEIKQFDCHNPFVLLNFIIGSSDPLPFIIDIRGLLTNLVVDRAATLASHGFAVFAFDYFMPRRLKSQEENIYMDSQAFLVSCRSI